MAPGPRIARLAPTTPPRDNRTVSSRRTILLVKTAENGEHYTPGSPAALNTVTIGSFAEIARSLRDFNTAADGDPESRGVLHGPGIVVQLPMLDDDDPVNQILVSINDDEIAWPVLLRICRSMGWKMMDPQSGRTFG